VPVPRFRPALWPTLMALPAFLVLIGLGVWQLERLHWKEGLIAAREIAITASPVAVPRSAAAASSLEFHRVSATGEFLNDREFFLGASDANGNTGYHVITPLRLDDGALLLVDRGWIVPDNRCDINYWFWLDIPAMAHCGGLDRVLPFTVDAGPAPNPGGYPRGGVTRIALPNDHLQYAITWFALAIGLAVIYVLYHRGRKQEPG
jgi:surfeit locus 1 family protein